MWRQKLDLPKFTFTEYMPRWLFMAKLVEPRLNSNNIVFKGHVWMSYISVTIWFNLQLFRPDRFCYQHYVRSTRLTTNKLPLCYTAEVFLKTLGRCLRINLSYQFATEKKWLSIYVYIKYRVFSRPMKLEAEVRHLMPSVYFARSGLSHSHADTASHNTGRLGPVLVGSYRV